MITAKPAVAVSSVMSVLNICLSNKHMACKFQAQKYDKPTHWTHTEQFITQLFPTYSQYKNDYNTEELVERNDWILRIYES